MAGIAEPLPAFLAEAMRTPFAWGSHDCCLWPADWILQRRGVDPAADLRGRYRTALGCGRLVKRLGGLQPLIAARLAAIGLAPTDAPIAGDVGVVFGATPSGPRTAGAICTGPRWAVLGVHGLLSARFSVSAAWRV